MEKTGTPVIPRDGMTARCERFSARIDYLGASYIRCKHNLRNTIRFDSAQDRDAHYRKHCCNDCGACVLNLNTKEHFNAPDTLQSKVPAAAVPRSNPTDSTVGSRLNADRQTNRFAAFAHPQDASVPLVAPSRRRKGATAISCIKQHSMIRKTIWRQQHGTDDAERIGDQA